MKNTIFFCHFNCTTVANIRSFFWPLFTSVLTRILDRVRKWGDLGKMKSFVKQREIKLGLDESYRELRACSMRFNVRSLFFPVCILVCPSLCRLDHNFWTYRTLCIWKQVAEVEKSKRFAGAIMKNLWGSCVNGSKDYHPWLIVRIWFLSRVDTLYLTFPFAQSAGKSL